MADQPAGGKKPGIADHAADLLKRGLTGAETGAFGGPETAAAGAAIGIAMGIKQRQQEARERKRQAKEEKSERRKEEQERIKQEWMARMPKGPLLGWIGLIIFPLFWALRMGFRWIWDTIAWVLRPVKWALEAVVVPLIQIPFRLLGSFLGVVVVVLMFVGLAYLFVFTYPPVMVWFVEHGIDSIGDAAVWLVSQPSKMFANIDEQFKYRMALATGQYWQGEEEGEETGIRIDKVTPTQPTFYTGDPIAVDVALVGRGNFYDIEGDLSASCRLVDDSEQGRTFPETIPMSALSNSREGFECDFGAYDIIDEPTKEVKATIQFPFETEGRVTLVFMDEATIKQLRREEKEPAAVYGFPETPVSTFKSGPVMIGLGTVRSNPIGVGSGYITTALGFTFQNKWDGEIVNITAVEITLDEGLSLPSEYNTRFRLIGPRSDGRGRKTYTVPMDYLRKLTHSGEAPIDTFASMQFKMKVDKSVLASTVVSPREVSVRVVYDYRLSKSARITLDYSAFGDSLESSEGTCGGRVCGTTQKCCRNVETDVMTCKSLCAVPKEEEVIIDYTIEKSSTKSGASCGNATCASGQVCCSCILSECRSVPYKCDASCDGVTYRQA